MVTPFMGVWIEIYMLKLFAQSLYVTPFMGVWIEIFLFFLCLPSNSVTPFMGVWIEMLKDVNRLLKIDRHTLYGCVD